MPLKVADKCPELKPQIIQNASIIMKLQLTHIMKLLQSYNQPVALSEIQRALEGQVPERTLRRWLKKLVDEKMIIATGKNKSRRYQLATQQTTSVTYDMTPLPNAALVLREPKAKYTVFNNLDIIKKVRRPLFQREPCTYNEAWVKAYTPNQDFYLSETQRRTLHDNCILLLDDKSIHTYTAQIFNRLLIDLSYNSSRLEGNTYSLIETQELVLSGKSADEKLDMEKMMILNHKHAIKYLIEGIRRIAVDETTIRTMHYLLSEGLVQAEESGQIRQAPVRISMTAYIPIEGQQRLSNLLTYIAKTAARINDPFEQSFFLLVHISYLQAFIDVNKRTARLSANIPLILHNVAPLSFNDINKDDYISSVIAIYEYNEPSALAELYTWSYLRSCKQYQVSSEALGIDIIHVRYRDLRRQLIAQIIHEKIIGDAIQPVIEAYAQQHVPSEDFAAFIENVTQELAHLELFKLFGMGISDQEFLAWRQAQDLMENPK